jgi:hypothetical protein
MQAAAAQVHLKHACNAEFELVGAQQKQVGIAAIKDTAGESPRRTLYLPELRRPRAAQRLTVVV